MKLLNHTLKYLAIALLPILGVWAVVFYLNMLDEVYDSLDDGLDNYKLLIINRAQEDSTILNRHEFGESNYAIREIPASVAQTIREQYKDTLMYMPDEADEEPVRLLRTAFRQGDRFYELKVITSMVEEDDLLEDLFYAMIWLYVAILISILLLHNFVLKKIWRPFYQLLDQLKQFRIGKDTALTPTSTTVKEFKDLQQAVQLLLERSAESYNNQKQFTENAAHELQTPLAISINKLELLAENPSLDQAAVATLVQVTRTLERLSRLNKSLLLLSKIENKQFPETERVHFNKLIRQLATDFEDMAEHNNIRLTIEENSDLYYTMHPGLAQILVSNFIKNAIVHNIPGGAVTIRINTDRFTISNTGQHTPLDTRLIFERFSKGDPDKPTTGLGLSIVKAIAALYDISVSYHYQEQHVMAVSFPVFSGL